MSDAAGGGPAYGQYMCKSGRHDLNEEFDHIFSARYRNHMQQTIEALLLSAVYEPRVTGKCAAVFILILIVALRRRTRA